MKLIELLVQETLCGKFKWPEGMKYLAQYVDGSLFSGNSYESYYRYDRVDDFGKDEVTREQYEAALAAAQQGWISWSGGECPVSSETLVDCKRADGDGYDGYPAKCIYWHGVGEDDSIIAYRPHEPESYHASWNGEGLPPVGCEFEYGTHRTKAKCLAIGHHMVFASKGDPDDEEGDFEEFLIDVLTEFHPLRSEADKNRDAIIDALSYYTADCDAIDIYDAIAAGKIPGLKLDV